MEREGVVMVTFHRQFVPIEQDDPCEERKDTGNMKQNLPHCGNVSTGENMCAITGKSWGGNRRFAGDAMNARFFF